MSTKLFQDPTTTMAPPEEQPVRTMQCQEETYKMAILPGSVKLDRNVRNVVRPRRGHDY